MCPPPLKEESCNGKSSNSQHSILTFVEVNISVIVRMLLSVLIQHMYLSIVLKVEQLPVFTTKWHVLTTNEDISFHRLLNGSFLRIHKLIVTYRDKTKKRNSCNLEPGLVSIAFAKRSIF